MAYNTPMAHIPRLVCPAAAAERIRSPLPTLVLVDLDRPLVARGRAAHVRPARELVLMLC